MRNKFVVADLEAVAHAYKDERDALAEVLGAIESHADECPKRDCDCFVVIREKARAALAKVKP